MKIDAKRFRDATGIDPKDDDLERCNCQRAGEIGHFMCGWDYERNMPVFMPSPPAQRTKNDDL